MNKRVTPAKARKMLREHTYYVAEHDGRTWWSNGYFAAPLAMVPEIHSAMADYGYKDVTPGSYMVAGRQSTRHGDSPNISFIIQGTTKDQTVFKTVGFGRRPVCFYFGEDIGWCIALESDEGYKSSISLNYIEAIFGTEALEDIRRGDITFTADPKGATFRVWSHGNNATAVIIMAVTIPQ